MLYMGPVKFLYNSKFDFTAKSLVTNSVIIRRVLCIRHLETETATLTSYENFCLFMAKTKSNRYLTSILFSIPYLVLETVLLVYVKGQ